MAQTSYTTPTLSTPELMATAMFDLANLTQSLGYGTGAYEGVGFISAVIADNVLTVTLTHPLSPEELAQYSFS